MKVRGVLQKGKLRPESERERKARSEMGEKKTQMSRASLQGNMT